MAQITKEMAQLIIEAEGNYPLTAWEVKQLAYAWLRYQDALAGNKVPAVGAGNTATVPAQGAQV